VNLIVIGLEPPLADPRFKVPKCCCGDYDDGDDTSTVRDALGNPNFLQK
jgi:hypothetical protein